MKLVVTEETVELEDLDLFRIEEVQLEALEESEEQVLTLVIPVMVEMVEQDVLLEMVVQEVLQVQVYQPVKMALKVNSWYAKLK